MVHAKAKWQNKLEVCVRNAKDGRCGQGPDSGVLCGLLGCDQDLGFKYNRMKLRGLVRIGLEVEKDYSGY